MNTCEQINCPNIDNCHSDNPDTTLGCVPATEPQKADGIQNQILIYSKNWYGSTNNAIEDIRAIMANYSGCHISYINDEDAQANIIGAFETYCPTYDRIEALMTGLGVKKLFPNREPNIYDLMLAKLSCTLGDCVDMTKKLDISFKGDKKYVIYSKSEDGYWSNEYGWVDEVDETDESMIFSHKEHRSSTLPMGGEWAEYTPNIINA